MRPCQLKKISAISIIFNVLFWVLFCIAKKELFLAISDILHYILTGSAFFVMLIVFIIIPYWLYKAILFLCVHKDENKCLLINVCALCANFISYEILKYELLVGTFVNWVIVIFLLVFFIRKAIWKIKSKVVATTVFTLACILGLSILFSPYYNPFDITSKYDKKTFRTDYGDKITFVYEEYNFPDASCSLTITDSECKEPIYLGSDPPKHWIELIDMIQIGENNIYISNDVFLVKNTRTKEFTEHEIEELIPKDAFEAYEKSREIIKKVICSGNIYWVVGYSEPFIINGDVDVINTVVNIGNDDSSFLDEPINVRCPDETIREKNLYASEEYFYAVDFCKELIKKYKLEYIGENAIHDNSRNNGI